ncbi:MAG: phage portal protein [Lachnospiraceae bacterium]|nr:phage portal protein [Lachnospiraceae bacterium]
MYKFSKEQVLKPEFLTKLINRFKKKELKKYYRAQQYYEAGNEIKNRSMSELKSNNKIAHAFARYMTNMATAYFIGKPIRYTAENEKLQEALDKILTANYINTVNFDVSKEASKKGIGFLLMYIDEKPRLRIKKLNAEDIIPVFSNTLGEYLECAVRLAEDYDIDGKLLHQHVYVYDETLIYHYRRENAVADYVEILEDRQEHKLGDVPVICFLNNEELMGDYEAFYDVIDAYDKAQSNSANDADYFSDAYLAVVGAGGGLEDALNGEEADGSTAAKNLRENKLLFLDEKGQAYFIEKKTDDAAAENYKNRLFKDLFFLSQVPALTDENFSGNLSGVAIRYKLIGLEELAIMKENCFRPAQHKMLKMITTYINLMQNKEYDPNSIKQQYERNFIDNDTETIENAGKLEGIVSKETQLCALPQNIVGNVREEMERIQKETMENEQLPYVKVDNINVK